MRERCSLSAGSVRVVARLAPIGWAALLVAQLLLAPTGLAQTGVERVGSVSEQTPQAASEGEAASVDASAWAQAPEPPFPALRQDGEVAIALRTLWNQQYQMPSTPRHLSSMLTAREGALEVIQAQRRLSVGLVEGILRDTPTLEPRDLISLGPVLEAVGPSDSLAQHLVQRLSGPVPGRSAEGNHPEELLARWFILDLLQSYGRAGHDGARGRLLEALPDLDSRLVPRAVQHYYDLSTHRRTAQIEMGTRLRPEHRYLLYVH
jgi:hypothetical protein